LGARFALGGGPLPGFEIMRLIYAGGSDTTTNDSLSVVCGIVVGTDQQWLALEDDIAALRQYIPVPYRPNFVFRACDLLKTDGGKFDHETWPKEDRIRLLAQLVALPAKHQVPVAFGWCKNVHLDVPGADSTPAIHLAAYAHAVAACDSFIARTGPVKEIALLLLEDTQDMKETVGRMYEGLKRHDFVKSLGGTISKDLPLRRIKDAANFVSSDRAPFLQLAMVCGSVIRHHWIGAPENESLLGALLGGGPVPAELSRSTEATAGSMCLHWRVSTIEHPQPETP